MGGERSGARLPPFDGLADRLMTEGSAAGWA